VERILQALAGDLTAAQLHGILRLRAEVFVVEQDCVYLDPDGRDVEPATRHLWIEDDGQVVACLRVLSETDGGSSIGRVATTPAQRSRGLAAELVKEALADTPRPVRIKAQTYLVDWYARFGFEVSGDPFLEDGIPHTPMALFT
jgi:ElaA protein